jgi:hypothetical protein
MKKLLSLLLTLGACAPGNKETSLQDSTESIDSIALVNSDEGEEVDVEGDNNEVYVGIDDSVDIRVTYDGYKAKFEEASVDYQEVHIYYNQYEARSEVTWLFDETLAPRYFFESYAMEGNEGSTEYYIKNNEVICAEEVDNTETKKWCEGKGALLKDDEPDGAINKEPLSENFKNSCNQNLASKLNALRSILSEGEKTDEDENTYRVKIEKVVNYGEDMTESVEVVIPKKVYVELMGSD